MAISRSIGIMGKHADPVSGLPMALKKKILCNVRPLRHNNAASDPILTKNFSKAEVEIHVALLAIYSELGMLCLRNDQNHHILMPPTALHTADRATKSEVVIIRRQDFPEPLPKFLLPIRQ